MKAAVAIESLKDNKYFADKSSALFDVVDYLHSRPQEEELYHLLRQYEVLIIGARERINAGMLTGGDRVATRVVGTLSVGTDHLDLPALEQSNIDVVNCPTANARSVAEHAIMLTLALTKRLKEADQVVQRMGGRHDLNGLPVEVLGKTLGLIGHGKIGREIGRLARCLGMNVIASTKTRTSGEYDDIRFVEIDELAARSDIICVSVPLDDSTDGLIGEAFIHRMRSTAIIVNTSRSEVVDETAVKAALNESCLGGYAGDGDSDSVGLALLPNAIMTPHIAGITVESIDRLDNELIDRLADHLAS